MNGGVGKKWWSICGSLSLIRSIDVFLYDGNNEKYYCFMFVLAIVFSILFFLLFILKWCIFVFLVLLIVVIVAGLGSGLEGFVVIEVM